MMEHTSLATEYHHSNPSNGGEFYGDNSDELIDIIARLNLSPAKIKGM